MCDGSSNTAQDCSPEGKESTSVKQSSLPCSVLENPPAPTCCVNITQQEKFLHKNCGSLTTDALAWLSDAHNLERVHRRPEKNQAVHMFGDEKHSPSKGLVWSVEKAETRILVMVIRAVAISENISMSCMSSARDEMSHSKSYKTFLHWF